jgi:invasion protein IalB
MWIRLIAAFGLAVAGIPALVDAQDEPTEKDTSVVQRFADWALRCRPEAEGQPKTCRMVQSIVTAEGKRPVLQVVVGRFGAERTLGAVIFVPIGVRLRPGLGLQIDGGKAQNFPFERCRPSSCQAEVVLDDALLKSLKSGLVGNLTFQDGSGRELKIAFSLKGFTAAFEALP